MIPTLERKKIFKLKIICKITYKNKIRQRNNAIQKEKKQKTKCMKENKK